ncbi:MAG TPA: hypothetical protein VGB70_06815 [Allosphingosinicella sp.]|jgi:hypothetical protein
MADRDIEASLEEALERIEAAILPSLSMILDSLLDSASLARPGTDADACAVEIRTLALELESIARQVEEVSPARRGGRKGYPAAASAA